MASRVLTMLVDDDALFRQLVKYELEDSGAFSIVAQASDGAEGILRATERANGLGLILLDLEMPGMGGLAALPGLRKCAPAASVVVLSMREDLEEAALALGAAGFVHKCLGARDLVQRLQKILRAPRSVDAAVARSRAARPAT